MLLGTWAGAQGRPRASVGQMLFDPHCLRRALPDVPQLPSAVACSPGIGRLVALSFGVTAGQEGTLEIKGCTWESHLPAPSARAGGGRGVHRAFS